MNVLIACESSGVVREAFRRLGHNAWSCDLLPADDASPYHVQGDALLLLRGEIKMPFGRDRIPWDFVGLHYTCTFFCNSGVRWMYGGKGSVIDPVRQGKMLKAADEFATLYCAAFEVPCFYFENPVMHGMAADAIGERIPDWQCKPTQIIQPWQHGHGETKATGLWLRGLPPLAPSNIVAGREGRVHKESPGPERWKARSRTLEGIAAAMATQWGGLTK